MSTDIILEGENDDRIVRARIYFLGCSSCIKYKQKIYEIPKGFDPLAIRGIFWGSIRGMESPLSRLGEMFLQEYASKIIKIETGDLVADYITAVKITKT